MKQLVTFCVTFVLVASAAFAQQYDLGSDLFSTGRVNLVRNTPTEIVPLRATRRFVRLSVELSPGGRVLVGSSTMTCGSDGTNWVAAKNEEFVIFEVRTQPAVWLCIANGEGSVSYIEFYDSGP